MKIGTSFEEDFADVLSVEDLIELRLLIESGKAQAIRDAALLNQSELARAMRCSPGAINKYESGLRLPRNGPLAARYLRALRRLEEKRCTA